MAGRTWSAGVVRRGRRRVLVRASVICRSMGFGFGRCCVSAAPRSTRTAPGEVPAQGFVEDDDTGEHREHGNQVCHGRGCCRAGVANDAVLQYIGQTGAENAEDEYGRQCRRRSRGDPWRHREADYGQLHRGADQLTDGQNPAGTVRYRGRNAAGTPSPARSRRPRRSPWPPPRCRPGRHPTPSARLPHQPDRLRSRSRCARSDARRAMRRTRTMR